MKKIFLITIVILLLNNYLLSQNKYVSYPINNITQDTISYVLDIHFLNSNIGYLTAEQYVHHNYTYIYDNNYVYKTINGGVNWTLLWKPRYIINSKNMSVSFVNENIGYISKQNKLYKTVNGGNNFTEINTHNLLFINSDNTICASSNGDVFLIQEDLNRVFKYSDSQGFQKIKEYNYNISIKYIELSKLNNNVIYICGNKNINPYNPFFAFSTDGGANWNTILDGNSNPYGVGNLKHMSITNNGIIDVPKISGKNKLIEYNITNNSFSVLSSDWNDGNKISFGNSKSGYYLKYDMDLSWPRGAYKTTNGGLNWILDFNITNAGHFLNTVNKFYALGDFTYFTRSGGIAQFIIRKLDVNLASVFDNVSSTWKINIGGQDYNTPNNYYIRGGATTLSSPQYNVQGQPERIFYKWNDGNMNSYRVDYSLYYEGQINNYYKTKLRSTTAAAINYPPQTKAIRDAQGDVHQIHSSMDGGIFYSRSTDNGNTFSKEEVVNYYPYGANNFADGNLYPALGEVYNPLTPPPPDYEERNVVTTWQRREGNNEIIKFAYRTSIDNIHFYWATNPNYYITVPSSTPFNTNAQVFTSLHTLGQVHDYFSLIVYLRPNGGTTELVVQPKQSSAGSTPEEVIETGNISELSVTRHIDGSYHYLHFAYKKDNKIYYEKWRFYIYSGIGVGRESMYEDHTVSDGDGVTNRYTPRYLFKKRSSCNSLQGYATHKLNYKI